MTVGLALVLAGLLLVIAVAWVTVEARDRNRRFEAFMNELRYRGNHRRR